MKTYIETIYARRPASTPSKALGRAWAAAGYGTQFTDDEFSEGERIADSPVEQPAQPATGTSISGESAAATSTPKPLDLAVAKERLNTLFTQAKKLKVCQTDQQFVAYVCKLLKFKAWDVKALTSEHLTAIARDLKERSQQAA